MPYFISLLLLVCAAGLNTAAAADVALIGTGGSIGSGCVNSVSAGSTAGERRG